MVYGRILSTNVSILIFKFITLLFETVFSAIFSRFLGSGEVGLLTTTTAFVVDLIIDMLKNRVRE